MPDDWLDDALELLKLELLRLDSELPDELLVDDWLEPELGLELEDDSSSGTYSATVAVPVAPACGAYSPAMPSKPIR